MFDRIEFCTLMANPAKIGVLSDLQEDFMATFKGAIKTCDDCGREFKVSPSRIATAKYCSHRCAKKHRMTGRRDKRVTLVCEGCGNSFEEYKSHADRRRYCSHECRSNDPRDRKRRSENTSGAKNPLWKGGRTEHTDGYIYLLAPNHPFTKTGYVFEHRLVMEIWLRENDPDSKYLIRLGDNLYLSPEFLVHHDDEVKSNNDIDNLVCMTPGEHVRHHSAKRRSEHFTLV